MKSAPGKPKKKRFNWTLDESKYLSTEEVKKLWETCLKGRDIAVARHDYIPVRDWFMVELGLNAGDIVVQLTQYGNYKQK